MPSHQTCTQPELHDRRLPTADLMRISGGQTEKERKQDVIAKSKLLQVLLSEEFQEIMTDLKDHLKKSPKITDLDLGS